MVLPIRHSTLLADIIQTVSQRFEPSSRSLLMGEHPHPWLPTAQIEVGLALQDDSLFLDVEVLYKMKIILLMTSLF